MCDGGLQERILLPARKLHPAPALSNEQAALVETLAIGCHAVDRSGLKSGETALVIGAGPIGLAAMEFTKLAGARTIVLDMNSQRLAFVRERMGIADTLLASGGDDDVQGMADLTGGEMAHVVIDATGSNRSMSEALRFCAFAGRLVYVGITQAELTFPHAPILHRRELTLLASRNALPRDFARIISLIGSGQLDTGPWITHRVPFPNVVGEFSKYLKPESGVIKAMISLE